MRLAIICYGHFDATLALAKYLPVLHPGIKLHFFFLLNQAESICVENVDLQAFELANGFVDRDTLRVALGPELYDYMHPSVELDAFIFNSIKLSDIKNMSLLWTLRRRLESENFDLLHFVGNNNDWIIRLNRHMRGVPKVHTIHEPYPFTPLGPYRKLRFRWVIRQLLNSGSTIIVPSHISHDRLVSHFQTDHIDVRVIPFNTFEIYRSYGESQISREENLLLYYGAISDYKGVPDLIEVMQMVEKTDRDIKCVIAGAGSVSRNLVIPSNTEIINRYLANNEIANLNRRANIIVCPYRSASQSGVVMTSYAFGNPILATSVGAFPEMIDHGETGWLVPPNDKEALAKAILHLFSKPKLIAEMRAKTKSLYQSEDTWLKIANEHVSLYQSILETSTTPVQ